jgi:trimethylamine--corrinoid protein Co-methyltransferase
MSEKSASSLAGSGDATAACDNSVRAPRKGSAREARLALHRAPLSEADRPVWPGIEGGRLTIFSPAEMQRIHNAVLEVLSEIGLGGAIPSCVQVVTEMGGQMGSDGRLRFPRALVEDTVAMAARHFVLHGQKPQYDMEPWGKKVYFGTAGAAVHVVDPVTGEYRDSGLRDLYDLARLVDASEHIDFFQRTNVCRELTTSYDLDINTLYASVAGTAKHVGTSFIRPEHVKASIEMLHVIAGGEDKWRARPFVSQSNCFVVPPLRFAEDACRCLEVAVEGGMPVLLLSAGQAGATAPASLAGTVVQATAECLAGLVYVNALQRGATAIFGTWPFVSDLRTGSMSGGTPEQGLLSAALAQVGHFYDLTLGTASGMTDSKMIDAQDGYEKALSHALVGNAGANLIYESAGMHASLLGVCKESIVVDNDIIGAVQRTMRGIAVDDESLSLDTIRATCIGGPGHYLGGAQTMARMRRDFIYPVIGDRTTPNEWKSRGRPSYVDRAVERTAELLARHYPQHIDAAADAAVRERYPIQLPREAMKPA